MHRIDSNNYMSLSLSYNGVGWSTLCKIPQNEWNAFLNNVEIMVTHENEEEEFMFFKLKNQISSKTFFGEWAKAPEIQTGVFTKCKGTYMHSLKFFTIPAYATLTLEYNDSKYQLLQTLSGYNHVRYVAPLLETNYYLDLNFNSKSFLDSQNEKFWIAKFEDCRIAEKNGVKFIGHHFCYTNTKLVIFLFQYLLRKKFKYLQLTKLEN